MPWQILNTMIAASLAALIVVAASSLAGYGFSRFDFRGKDFLLISLLGCVMVSGATKVVPLYLMLHKLGLLNSLSGLGLVYSVEFLPISVWLMKSYVDTVPIELDEAASVDGCSRLRTFVRIVFPLSMPGVIAVALITFVRSAQEFIYAATFLTETGVKTSPVGLYMFFTELGVEWGQLTAASLVVVLPDRAGVPDPAEVVRVGADHGGGAVTAVDASAPAGPRPVNGGRANERSEPGIPDEALHPGRARRHRERRGAPSRTAPSPSRARASPRSGRRPR